MGGQGRVWRGRDGCSSGVLDTPVTEARVGKGKGRQRKRHFPVEGEGGTRLKQMGYEWGGALERGHPKVQGEGQVELNESLRNSHP